MQAIAQSRACQSGCDACCVVRALNGESLTVDTARTPGAPDVSAATVAGIVAAIETSTAAIVWVTVDG